MPCKRPSIIEACNATTKVMVVVAEAIDNSLTSRKFYKLLKIKGFIEARIFAPHME